MVGGTCPGSILLRVGVGWMVVGNRRFILLLSACLEKSQGSLGVGRICKKIANASPADCPAVINRVQFQL